MLVLVLSVSLEGHLHYRIALKKHPDFPCSCWFSFVPVERTLTYSFLIRQVLERTVEGWIRVVITRLNLPRDLRVLELPEGILTRPPFVFCGSD